MKKLYILFVAAIAMATATFTANAQDNPFTKGNVMIQALIGLPDSYMRGISEFPPVNGAIEYCVADFGPGGSLGVGGSVEYNKAKAGFSNTVVEAIADYHYFFNPKFDVHAKLGIGYWNGYGEYGTSSRSAFVGVTYYSTDKLALIAEVGYSFVTNIRAGFAFKF